MTGVAQRAAKFAQAVIVGLALALALAFAAGGALDAHAAAVKPIVLDPTSGQQRQLKASDAPVISNLAASAPSVCTDAASALTTSGCFALTSPEIIAALGSQSANTILAGPCSGSAAPPGFRVLCAADIAGLALHGGDITPACPPDATAIGFLGAPPAGGTPYTGNHTLGCTTGTYNDFGEGVTFCTSSGATLTIPTNATIAAPIGTTIPVANAPGCAGNLTISPAAGVNLYLPAQTYSAAVTYGPNALATLYQVSANNWFLTGLGVGPNSVAGVAPTLRGGNSAGTSGTSVTVNFPAGTAVGDLGVLFSASCNFASDALPSGWSQILALGFSYHSLIVRTKTLTSGDISTGSVTETTSSCQLNDFLVVFASPIPSLVSIGAPGLSANNNSAYPSEQYQLLTPVGRQTTNELYLMICTVRGNVGQTISTGTLIGSSITASNGSGALYYYSFGSAVPYSECINQSGIPAKDLILGFLN